jgi:hypothetical protein
MEEVVMEGVREIETICNTASTKIPYEIGRKLTEIHPTLQQQFMRIVVGFIMEQGSKSYYDERNRATVELCRELKKVLEKSGYYRDGEIVLPFV